MGHTSQRQHMVKSALDRAQTSAQAPIPTPTTAYSTAKSSV